MEKSRYPVDEISEKTILGVILIFSPFSGDAITKVTGAFLLVVAVFDLIDNYILQK